MNLNPVYFNWKQGTDEREITGLIEDMGFIAQELQEVLPTLVRNTGEYLAIRDKGLFAIIVQSIKEQNKKIQALEAKVDELNKKIGK